MNNNIILNILLLISLIPLHSFIVVIPFKIYRLKEPDNFTSYDVIYNWGKNILYSNALIGTPTQKISLVLHSQSLETDLYQHMCDVPGSKYNKESSNSFSIQKVIFKHNYQNNCSQISETIYLYDDINTKELKPFEKYNLLYSDNEESVQGDLYEYHDNTCLNIGFRLGYLYGESEYNLIEQLKKKYDILETYDFSLKYDNETDGEIVIGVEPHIYDPENYFQSQQRVVKGVCQTDNSQRDFALNFDKIYLSYKNKTTSKMDTKIMSNENCVKIKLDMGVVLGSSDYKNVINELFFDKLMGEEKCFEETVVDKRDNSKYDVYYCNKASTENIIKNEFPTIYFDMKQFNETFELNYKDLFREKGDKIYFLVYFKKNSYFSNYFEIGSIFLRKYFFTFNQNTKMIGYYNEDLPGGKKKKKNNDKDTNFLSFLDNRVLIVIIAILVIIFGIVGFLFGKMVYDKVRKKRINEVDDNYDYFPEQNNGKGNDNNNNNEKDKLGINEADNAIN